MSVSRCVIHGIAGRKTSYFLSVLISKGISLDDFELLRVIGRGSYAKVLMVELKETKRIYAMKVFNLVISVRKQASSYM